jgi:hypothetical protein
MCNLVDFCLQVEKNSRAKIPERLRIKIEVEMVSAQEIVRKLT